MRYVNKYNKPELIKTCQNNVTTYYNLFENNYMTNYEIMVSSF